MRRRPILVALIILSAALAGIYFFVPQLRLWLHASSLKEVSGAQWVDAHRYDSQWFDAARAGRVDILRLLHDAHYPIDTQTSSGYTALILAAYDEQPDALEYLLEAGANACMADRHGNTALMGAIYKGRTAIVQRLLRTHCSIDQINNAGETALGFAVLFGRRDLLERLVRQGARLDRRNAQGQTPLAVATMQGNQEMVEALRRLGAMN